LTNPTYPTHIALQFNAWISAHDLSAQTALISADHSFIEWDGQVTVGQGAMIDAWQRFFALLSDC